MVPISGITLPFTNMKKTLTLLPDIIAAIHDEVDMAHASMLGPPPSYTAMQEVLDHRGYSEDDYERFLLQVQGRRLRKHCNNVRYRNHCIYFGLYCNSTL